MLFSAEIFISAGEWVVQMPTLTEENSQFLQSGPQEVSLVMGRGTCSTSTVASPTKARQSCGGRQRHLIPSGRTGNGKRNALNVNSCKSNKGKTELRWKTAPPHPIRTDCTSNVTRQNSLLTGRTSLWSALYNGDQVLLGKL